MSDVPNGSGFSQRRWHMSLVFEARTPDEIVLQDDMANLLSWSVVGKVARIPEVREKSVRVRSCQVLGAGVVPVTVLADRGELDQEAAQ